jgi:mannosyl-glycoprotein endo-beta-N-acetylglucosaminidase
MIRIGKTGRRCVNLVLFCVPAVFLIAGCHVGEILSYRPQMVGLNTDEYAPHVVVDARTLIDYVDSRTPFGMAAFGPVTSVQPGVSVKVRPRKTMWGTPWDHRELCRNMDAILRAQGIDSFDERARMVAHAVVASGWRQNVWNYNAWGVQLGSWSGPHFTMNTTEMTPDGEYVMVRDTPWRSFDSWKDAVDDYRSRITSKSNRVSYRKAHEHLVSASRKSDAAFWEALGEGNYYTAANFSKKKYAVLCRAVRRIIAE